MRHPFAIDLFCGLGGWTDGLLAEGYEVVGFDVERHDYGTGGYPAHLVIQDALTLHGRQFKDADLIVASPPCQAYSYRAMPWKKAKALPPPDNTLFEACFRIQQEAIAAADRLIPLVVENVYGAQKWVGRARWHYGSFYLWGDVPALMPIVSKFPKGAMRNNESVKVTTMGAGWHPPDHPKHVRGLAFNGHAERNLGIKGIPHRPSGHWTNPAEHDRGVYGEPLGKNQLGRSNSSARKAASAQIAKIPFPLAQWIARAWKPITSV